ncbi:hypothetical protein [Persicitalea jodogahamensis]|uniref:Uncharacterized protein n=1 Tax=Persicitalea jodogahamensis TaxID=402147 RepID=A0A8J3D846_9BACT|nr:hypothetical protein [Persicitalea jodogahamensis]GHB63990.1 hypothetical protein GCM10007390_17330 [Persicitalea jodogahamensis]
MRTLLFDTETKLAGEMRYGRYLVDGQPGPLPDYLVELTVIQLDAPEPEENEVVEIADPVADIENGQYLLGWTVRPMNEAELAALNPIPDEVAAWRLRVVVERAGLKPVIDAVIASLDPDNQMVAKEAYYGGTTVRRDSPLLDAVIQVAQLTTEQKNGLFIQAANLPG